MFDVQVIDCVQKTVRVWARNPSDAMLLAGMRGIGSIISSTLTEEVKARFAISLGEEALVPDQEGDTNG